jgi:hypothetical protein
MLARVRCNYWMHKLLMVTLVVLIKISILFYCEISQLGNDLKKATSPTCSPKTNPEIQTCSQSRLKEKLELT